MISTLVLHNDINEVGLLAVWLEQVINEVGLSEDCLMPLNLALEEATVNVMNYAFPKDEIHSFQLIAEWENTNSNVIFTIIDNGIPFNPLEQATPDISLNAEERPIGGLGIYLVKTIMQSIEYEYKDGKNILTMNYKS